MTDPRTALAALIPGLSKARVLVVGDLMLDHYVHGTVGRMAPESTPEKPVPVLAITSEEFIPGGAAGVVANIGGLGAYARVMGAVAQDSAGEKMRTLLQSMNADTQYINVVNDRPSIVKMRFVKDDQLLLRTDYEIIKPLSPADEQDLISRVDIAMKDCGAVIMSDYGKGVLSAAVMKAVIEAAQKNNMPVLVDPKGKDFTIYRGADYITPNAKELSEATNMPVATEADITKAAQHLVNTAGIKTVIAKRSEHGVMVITKDGVLLSLPAVAKEVRGVAGAGDTVIATLATSLAAGLLLDQAITLANEAAGVIVAKPGTTPIDKEELQRHVAR